jgi:MFS transporter, putative metabolite:H+ symporter
MPTILERLDSTPLTILHALAALLCAAGFGIDLMEISVGNALSAVFSAPPYALSSRSLAWLLASVYVGAVIGAPLLGWMADRRGVRRTLMVTLLWLGLTASFAAASANPQWLTVFRFLSGVALGAYPPLMIAYLTSIAPPRYRGLMIFWVCGAAYLAPPVAVFAIRWLTPIHPFGIEGWRWPFAMAGVAALVVGVMFSRIPESARWLLAKGRDEAAEGVCSRFESSRPLWGKTLRNGPRAAGDARHGWDPAVVDALRVGSHGSKSVGSVDADNSVDGRARAVEFAVAHDNASHELGLARDDSSGEPAVATFQFASRARLKRHFAFIAALYFSAPWAMAAFPLLTGPILLARGYNLTDTLLYIGLATFGPAVSTFTVGPLVDRIERRVSLSLCCVLMLLAVGIFFTLDGPVVLTISVVSFSIGVAIYTAVMTMYGAELFPTSSRARATSAAWAGNRVASVLMPLVMLPLLHQAGSLTVAVVISLVLVGTIAFIALWGPRGAAARAVE